MVLVGVAVALFFLYSETEAGAFGHGEEAYVLVAVTDAQGGLPEVAHLAVVGASPQGKVIWLGLPLDLSLPDPAGGWAPISSLYSSEGAEGMAERAAGLLEVPVEHWVELELEAFPRLVDAAGGVEFAVEPGSPPEILDGQQTIELLRAHQGEADRLDRWQRFLGALLGGLRPLPWSRWQELGESEFERSRSNLTLWEWLSLAKRLRSSQVAFVPLPTLTGEGGRRPDLVRLHKFLLQELLGKRLFTRDEVRTLVLNGTGERFLARRAELWFGELGFAVVGTGPADRFDYEQTLLLYPPAERPKAELLAEALPKVETMAAADFGPERLGGWPEGVDVIVILGAEFQVGG